MSYQQITVTKVVLNTDMRGIHAVRATVTKGEGVLFLNKACTIARLICPHLAHKGQLVTTMYAPKGEVYDVALIQELVLGSLSLRLGVRQTPKLAKLRKAA